MEPGFCVIWVKLLILLLNNLSSHAVRLNLLRAVAAMI